MRYGGHRTYKYNYTSVYLCPVPKARLEHFVLNYALSLLKRQTHFQTFQKFGQESFGCIQLSTACLYTSFHQTHLDRDFKVTL